MIHLIRGLPPRLLLAPLLVAILAATVPPAVAGSPDDSFWSAGFAAPAFDGAVSALTSFEGDLIAGGMFRQTPDGMASGVARWDRSKWHSMGNGLYQVRNFEVFRGQLVAAGFLRPYDSDARQYAVVWDGREWNPLGAPGVVRDFTVMGDELIACGSFDWTDSLTMAARWDGSTWRPFGNRIAPGIIAVAATCAVYQGQLYVGGMFRAPTDTSAALLVRWTGSAWESLAVGRNRSEVYALATYDAKLYIGGEFAGLAAPPSPPLPPSPLLTWDGTSIAPVGPYATEGVVRSLVPTPSGLLVGGRSGSSVDAAARVTLLSPGSTQDFPGLSGDVYAVVMNEGRVVAGGIFSDSGGAAPSGGRAINLAEWHGGGWVPLEGSASDGHGLLALDQPVVQSLFADQDTLFVSGRFDFARNGTGWTTVSDVARWDGRNWSPIGFPGLHGWVWALTRYRGQLIAGGDFYSLEDPEHVRNIARWDGSTWRPLGSGVDAQVVAFAVMNDQLIVGGSLSRAGEVDVRGIARWDGESWDSMGPIQFFGEGPRVNSLLVRDDTLYVGGSFTQLGGVDARNVMTWSGTNWAPLGNGFDQEVLRLTFYKGELTASGRFNQVEGVQAYGIARWDGQAWIPFPGEIRDRHWPQIFAMCTKGEDLFVGGVFDEIAGVPAMNVARWDGSRWYPLGSGIGTQEVGFNSWVGSVAEFQNSLYAGGTFSTAGGKRSSHIARWDGIGSAFADKPTLMLASGRPNPFMGQVLVPFWLPTSSRVEAQVVDLTGRRVRTLLLADLPAGYHPAVWDGTNEGGSRARAGVYYVTVRSGTGALAARKVVLLP